MPGSQKAEFQTWGVGSFPAPASFLGKKCTTPHWNLTADDAGIKKKRVCDPPKESSPIILRGNTLRQIRRGDRAFLVEKIKGSYFPIVD